MMKKSIVRPETSQLAENALKEHKKKVGEVILVAITPRTTIELPANLSQAESVSLLFSTAFDMSVDLNILDNEIKTRNDIVHRFGHTKKGEEICFIKDNVLFLIAKVNNIVEKIAKEMKATLVKGMTE